ncbi:DNA ligase 1-like isoform X2 [Scomber scombrus]
MKEQELHPTRQQEAPNRSINGGVAVETELEEETRRKKEKERWKQLFPEIKKCIIVITRSRPEKLDMLKLKEERRKEEEEKEEGEEEGGGKSADPEPACDWMKPLELHDVSNKSKRFVKKVEVKVSSNNRCRREKKNPPSIVFKKVGGDQWVLRTSKVKKEKEEEEEEKKEEKKEDKGGDASQPKQIKRRNSCSRCAACLREDCGKCTHCLDKRKFGGQDKKKQRCMLRVCLVVTIEAAKETVTTTTLTNTVTTATPADTVTTATRSHHHHHHQGKKLTCQKDTTEEEEEEKKKEERKQRLWERNSCSRCAACLREDCGKCMHCLDKRKFGGQDKKKKRCMLRVCLVVETTSASKLRKTIEAAKETVTTTTLTNTVTTATPADTVTTATRSHHHHHHQGKKLTRQKDTTEEEEEEKKKEERKRRLWERRKAKRRQSKEDEFPPELLKELEKVEKKMQEEEQKKEAQTPKFPAEELLNGTHIQLNLTLDGSHFYPSILSDSDFSSLSALLPEEGSVLHMSTGLTYIPPPPAPPSLHPLPLKEPKEEEQAVDIDEYGRTGGKGEAEDWVMEEEEERAAGQIKEEEEEEAEWMMENEKECREGVTEEGKYYDIQVEVPGFNSDKETLMASSDRSEITDDVTAKVTDDVTAFYPPELISLSSGSVSLLGGSGGEVTSGRGLLRLLRELRRTVLPAHWVAVVADGPLLQLLQCSRLSSMLTTIIHIQPDLCFFITLVSLLLELEKLVVCRGSRVRCCHLLVAPPCFTCLPCLIGGDEEEDEDEDDDEEEEEEESSADNTP